MSAGRAGSLEVGGRRLETLEIDGDPGRRAIVLLHEGLGSIGLWRDVPAELAARTGRRIVAFSRHGHGGSEPPRAPRTPAFFHEEARVVLPAVLEHLDVAEPILVGHSDGGSIALIHGGEAPVTGIVTIAAHVFVEDICVESIVGIRERFESGELRERLTRHHADVDAAFHGWCDVWLDPAFRSWTLDAEASAITAPALVIQAVDDPYATAAQVDRICAAIGPSATPLIAGGGEHSPHLAAAEEVLGAIAAFCEPLP